jgi:predicted secreted hydrolase
VEPGNASYYYSFTRLEAEGTLFLDDRAVPVRGQAWLDREWSTSVLSPGQVGWDWFALQLEDGRDLMYYQLRLADGTPHPLSKGILVDEDGQSRVLTAPEVDMTVLRRWENEEGTVYPSRWSLSVPGEGLELEVVPVLANQELDLTFRYWEGAVRIRGTDGSEPVSGVGYVELTGYSGDLETRPATSMSRGTSRP